jgi:hypothetical protein
VLSELGVVYSKSNAWPDLASIDSKAALTSTSDNSVASLRELDANSTYYVRAYARDTRGGVYYSAPQMFTTAQGFSVKTFEPENIGGEQATLSGSIERGGDISFKSKGFFYSEYSATLTAGGYAKAAYVSGGELGNFSTDISSLKPNTTYYARAFVDADGGYFYGNTVEFTTRGTVTVKLTFVDSRDEEVATQTKEVLAGIPIEAKDLTIPYQYVLSDSTWTFTTYRDDEVLVPVKDAEKFFMKGATNTTFEPDEVITREDVARIIYLLYGDNGKYTTPIYSDVRANYPYINEIGFVTSLGVMTGNTDGTFKPYMPIKRSEICVVLAKLYKLPNYTGENKFQDIAGHWGASFINAAAEAGMMTGNDQSFRPDDNASRAEAATIFGRAEKRSLAPLSDRTYEDVPETHWAYQYIMNASIPGR